MAHELKGNPHSLVSYFTTVPSGIRFFKGLVAHINKQLQTETSVGRVQQIEGSQTIDFKAVVTLERELFLLGVLENAGKGALDSLMHKLMELLCLHAGKVRQVLDSLLGRSAATDGEGITFDGFKVNCPLALCATSSLPCRACPCGPCSCSPLRS